MFFGIGVFRIWGFGRQTGINTERLPGQPAPHHRPAEGCSGMKHISLKENHLFSKAYAGGQKYYGRYTSVYVLQDRAAYRLMKANPQKEYINRLGITVSKKLGSAVVRSRLRRILREGFRAVEKEGNLKTGYIIVISAKAAAIGKKSTDIYHELKIAFGKLGLISAG